MNNDGSISELDLASVTATGTYEICRESPKPISYKFYYKNKGKLVEIRNIECKNTEEVENETTPYAD